MPQIIVDIDATGSVKVEAKDVSGPGCRQLTEAIEAAIGATVHDVTKPELWGAHGQSAKQDAQAEANQ